jgi:RimJ/RimL family protein N-acetyltransferase
MTPDQTATRVRLRDATLADADLLDEWQREVRRGGGFNDFGMEPRLTPRDVLAKGPLRDENRGTMIIERVDDGEPIGTVGWIKLQYGPNPESDVWNVGIELVPGARGQGYGTEAQRLITAYLFETTRANRVEASTDVTNLAEQRSLEKAGFTREGIARGAQFRAGKYHDLVVYSRLRGDAEREKAGS